ncbi:hypothetical protein ACFE04_031076 [Oxalis oulophora]
MEKICEFCTVWRPVVFCKADAAYLCLSCDSKVHSANALSNRHLRTLLCDSCRLNPAYFRCLDHLMFICRGCDLSLHDLSSQHQRKAICSYTRCPSAKDFAALWGFDLNEINRNETGSSRQQSDLPNKDGQLQQNTSFILQQIIELNRLQQTNINNLSPNLIRGQEQTDGSTSKNPVESFNQHSNISAEIENNLQLSNSTPLDSTSMFSQLDNLSLPSSSQLWSQNMQDLGICEDILSCDDLNIPEVDMTFRNFEDLFVSDIDPTTALLDNQDMSCSFFETDMDKSDNVNTKVMEEFSAASSVYFPQSGQDRDVGPSNQVNDFSGKTDFPRQIPQSYSSMSFSMSRLSAESTDCVDSGISPITGVEASCNLSDPEGTQMEAREQVITRYREKKKVHEQEKQTRYAPRKSRSDAHKRRAKGQLMKTGSFDSGSIGGTRSY